MRIGIVAPSTPIAPDVAEQAIALAAERFPRVELVFHPQCFQVHNHFAGDEPTRADAFVEIANDVGFDALWAARGGYGSCRIAEDVLARLTPAARDKAYLGYSDFGYMLAGLYRAGFPRIAHGPMVNDLIREDGEAAVARALDWLCGGAHDAPTDGAPQAAFNMTVLSQLLGTPLAPDLSSHVVMVEEVSEYLYRIDRTMFHLTSNPAIRAAAGLALGRCSLIPENDRPFGADAEEIAKYWCARAGITYVGRADIGHDSGNKVVPFGKTRFGAD